MLFIGGDKMGMVWSMVSQVAAELAELKQQINDANEKAKELEDKISYMKAVAVSEDKGN